MPDNLESPEDVLRHAEEFSPKERMGIPRQPMPERPAEERRRDQSEVPLGFDEFHAMLEACRCLECKNQPCVQGCPVGVDIPGFIRLIRQGDFQGAIEKIRECNCLPAVTGRVCPQEEQCELQCTLARARKDPKQSVSIGRLERFVADWERNRRHHRTDPRLAPTGKRVAIVGSGPAGLSAAGDLIRQGHEVTVFEAFHKFGGVLVYGIPEFRLPKEIVEEEVGRLADLGVRFEPNIVVGQTVTIDELLQEEGFDAVFLGTGAGLPLFLGIPGEELVGVYSANEYLTRANLMRAYDFPLVDTPVVRASRVAVVGGGNVAMDAARTALRLGADEVTLIYRRSRNEMPARAEEIHHAEEEGVSFQLLSNPVEILGDEDGRVRAVRCVRMELGEPDSSGRRRPCAVLGSEFDLPAELVIVAIGNGPNPLATSTTPDLQTDSQGRIVVDPATGKTSKRGVFAGGDVVLGAATVILAMGEGRKAARAIHEYLSTGSW